MSGSTDPDEGFERLLRGALPEDREEQELGAFVQDVRTAFPAAPLLAEESHLAAIGAAARLLAREGGPVIEGSEARPRRARIPGRRRLNVRVPIFRSLAARIVAGLAVLMWSLGGLAVAGALPGGIQDVVSNAAEEVQLNLSGDDVDDGDVGDVEDDEDVEDDADVDDADVDDEDDADDDQGEFEDESSDDDQGDDEQGDEDQDDADADDSDDADEADDEDDSDDSDEDD